MEMYVQGVRWGVFGQISNFQNSSYGGKVESGGGNWDLQAWINLTDYCMACRPFY